MHRSLTWSLFASGLLVAACGGDGSGTGDSSADGSTETTTESEASSTEESGGESESESSESGSESETGGECVPGTEGCPCDAEDACDDGLSCVSGYCVEYTPTCGDGILQDGEECDHGALNADDGICRSDCTIQSCGDGTVGPGEACDDGNDVDTDFCNNECKLPSCGNGVVEGDEECDDGNASDDDACPTTCLNATCGDTFVHEGEEECDDANGIDDDGCSNACEAQPVCGDGIVAPDELCFLPPVGITVLGGPIDIEAIEIAKPGDTPVNSIDLVVTVTDAGDGSGNSGVRILRGDNNGSFEEFARISTGFGDAVDAVVGDINLDGQVDIAVAHAASGTPGKEGNVVFIPANSVETEGPTFFGNLQEFVGQNQDACASDGDCGPTTAGTCFVSEGFCDYLGNELVIRDPIALSLGFLDDDTAPDIGIANRGTAENTLYYSSVIYGEFLINANDSRASNVQLSGAGVTPDITDITYGEYDGQTATFAVLESGNARVRPFKWDSADAVSLQASVQLPGSTFPVSMFSGDLDEDGEDDIAFGNWNPTCDYATELDWPDDCPCIDSLCEQVQVLRSASPTSISNTFGGKAPNAVAMGDFNFDGDVDLVIANEWSNNIHVVTSNGSAAFANPVENPIDGSRPNHIAVGDFNGDGVDDIAVSQEVTNLVTVLLSNP